MEFQAAILILMKVCDMIKKMEIKKRLFLLKKKGFTLIELLIVISIIGLLSSLLLANFQNARARARDAERKNDLRHLKTALRMYYNDNQAYPSDDEDGSIASACGAGGDENCTWGASQFGSDGSVYMSTLPQDPMGNERSYYYEQEDDGEGFALYACLENLSDDSIESCNENICSDSLCFKLTED
jgi:type II secretion system protein G